MATSCTSDIAVKHTVIESPSEMLIPFKLRDSGATDLKCVKSCAVITVDEFNAEKAVAKVIPVVVSREAKHVPEVVVHKEDDYKPVEGRMFLKDGKVGERYVVGDKVYEVLRISDMSVRVKIGNIAKPDYIAPLSEVVPFDPKKHAHLLIKKQEEEDV